MLADDAAVEAQVFGKDGVLASLPRGAIHISCSTVSVALCDRLAAEHAKARPGICLCSGLWTPGRRRSRQTRSCRGRPQSPHRSLQALVRGHGSKVWIVGEKQSLANVVKLSGNFLIASVLESLPRPSPSPASPASTRQA